MTNYCIRVQRSSNEPRKVPTVYSGHTIKKKVLLNYNWKRLLRAKLINNLLFLRNLWKKVGYLLTLKVMYLLRPNLKRCLVLIQASLRRSRKLFPFGAQRPKVSPKFFTEKQSFLDVHFLPLIIMQSFILHFSNSLPS